MGVFWFLALCGGIAWYLYYRATTASRAKLLEALTNAKRNGEAIPITYHGGSTPGRTREICPTAIEGNYVRALDADTGEEKTYRIDRMSLPGGIYIASNKSSTIKRVTTDQFIATAQASTDRFAVMDLSLSLVENVLHIHRRRKNGQPLVNSDARMYFYADRTSRQFLVSIDYNKKQMAFNDLHAAIDYLVAECHDIPRPRKV